MRSLPLVTFAILDDAQSAVFLKIEVPLSICVSNKLVGSLPAYTQSPSLPWLFHLHCRNPNLAKCGGEAQHLEKLGIWSPPGLLNVQSSTAGPKTPCIGVFLVSLESS